MGDSDLSASELRKRYHKGGTAGDDELTASQLRARHGIVNNSKEFSTSGGGIPVVAVVGILVVLIGIALAVYFNSANKA